MVKNRRFEKAPIIGTRHIQCFLCFCCLSICYALRVNLSVGIVAMTDRNSTNSNLTVYDWSEGTKSYVLSSFFWGYIVTQIPGGHIAQKYGAKTLLLIGITLCSVLTLLTPLAVEFGGWQLLFALRVIQGLLQGSVHPATHAMLAKWSPVEERGALSTFCYSGSQFGTVVILAISGIIAESPLGWPGIFYISGGLGILWGVCWLIFSASTPAEHKTISLEERKFIENSLGQVDSTPITVAPTPWSKIFTSPPFLSLIIVHCTHMWGFWTLLTQIPNYMKNILDVDMKNSALLSSLPYTVMLLLSFAFIYLSKVLARRENVSLAFSRKFFNSIGHWIPMISLIGLGYVTKEHSLLAVILLTLTVGISGATYLGFQVNHIDLSPNYAGTLMGITNGSANVMSALAPLAVGLVVTDVKNVVEWRIVFFIAAGFYFVGNLLFVIFGKTEVQSWNSPEETLAKRLNVVDAESPALLLNGDKKKITITENGTQ
ncbi:PREDICTED: putative inorganic phosphate cotransporter isoform X1 [Bactrocera latifrons]|uniref:Putative inorganic phosphate cotransporter n=2 Tax=Bactrocera latifrons TaxID=174628 RepID=A0A0K8VIK3_BACLA|nr:PREDICTED: putative inorganic phosphate cotransporter isoform X1 [Bactrocera latifrons]